MDTKRRRVLAHRDRSDFVIYRLMEGNRKQRAVHTFAYATNHCIWLSVHGLNGLNCMMIPEDAAMVKERIAKWCE
jgi:hypothetical protein